VHKYNTRNKKCNLPNTTKDSLAMPCAPQNCSVPSAHCHEKEISGGVRSMTSDVSPVVPSHPIGMSDPLHKWQPEMQHENTEWYYERCTTVNTSHILLATQIKMNTLENSQLITVQN
jgi:hypothetical protein